jgi:HSP20 family molecular chaperone IbpA
VRLSLNPVDEKSVNGVLTITLPKPVGTNAKMVRVPVKAMG